MFSCPLTNCSMKFPANKMLRLLILIKSPLPRTSTATTIKYLTTATVETTPSDPSSSLTLHFLKNSCGLSHGAALAASRKIHLKSTKKPHSVLSLLKSYNFTTPDISKIVARLPKLLLSDPTKILQPKLRFLESIGFSGPALVSLITSVPTLLLFSLNNKLVPNHNLLKSLLHTDDNVISAIRCSAKLLTADLNTTVLPHIRTLEAHGVPMVVLFKLLTMHARSLVAQPDRFDEIFSLVRQLDISPRSPVFAHAFGVLSKLPDPQWAKKVDNFKMCGWSEKQVMTAFSKHPYCMTASVDKVAKNMEVFRERLKWDPSYVSTNPVLLSLSHEKRILPRCRILSILEARGLIKGQVSSRHLMLGEKDFLHKYVVKYYEQVPELADDDIMQRMQELGLVDQAGKQQDVVALAI